MQVFTTSQNHDITTSFFSPLHSFRHLKKVTFIPNLVCMIKSLSANKIYANEAELLAALASSEQESNKALDYLYTKHFNAIERLVLNNSGNYDEAKDVYQEAIIVFYKDVRQNQLKLTCSISTYLYSICRNLWLKCLREKTKIPVFRDTQNDFLALEKADTDYDIDYDTNTERLINIATEQLATLGEKCRRILRYFFWERKNMDFIAQQLGYTNADNAKNQKSKCMKQLRDKFNSNKLSYKY
jgi:RNA polymerase sigma factor (sigma-70 family)